MDSHDDSGGEPATVLTTWFSVVRAVCMRAFEEWAARTKFAKLWRLAGEYRCTGRHARVE